MDNICFRIPGNVDSAKIIDLGSAIYFDRDKKYHELAGDIQYCSPEMFRNEGYTEKTDIWSLGIVMYHLMTGDFPFYSNDDDELMNKILLGHIAFIGKRFRRLSLPAMDLLKRCLAVDYNKRISAQDAFNHEFFLPNAMEKKLIRKGMVIVFDWVKKGPL